jgi:DNA repair photolyase
LAALSAANPFGFLAASLLRFLLVLAHFLVDKANKKRNNVCVPLARRSMTTTPTPSLFPGVPSVPQSGTAERTGIARLAASSPCARSKSDTEYFLLPVRSILNRCDSGRVPFAWTVNPYRGCEFGCRYCYARYTHEFMDLPGSDFEKKIFVKQNAAAIFDRDLTEHAGSLLPASCSPQPESIAIGTATDPYQPAEREFGVTRSLLERLAKRSGISLSITTKSNLITRDLDLLRRIAEKNELSINITVTTLRPRLARLLEPRAPRPDLRLAALRELRDAGIEAGVFAMPVLPGLTDREADLDKLFLAARDSGAQWLGAQVVFLRSAALKEFLLFLDGKFPKLARDYRRWYARTGYAPEKIRAEITARVRALRQKHGLASRPYAPDRLARASSLDAPQLLLPLAV